MLLQKEANKTPNIFQPCRHRDLDKDALPKMRGLTSDRNWVREQSNVVALSVTYFHYHLTNKWIFFACFYASVRIFCRPCKQFLFIFTKKKHQLTSLLPHILIMALDTLRTSIYHFINKKLRVRGEDEIQYWHHNTRQFSHTPFCFCVDPRSQ